MRIATLDVNGTATLAVRQGDNYVNLSKAAPDLPSDMSALIASGGLDKAKAAAAGAGDDAKIAVADATYLPVVANPSKIICCGLNYRDHAIETNNPIPEYPIIFFRMITSMAAHNAPMLLPKAASDYDYEAELAVIIGKGGKHIAKADALDCVAGYSCFNDGSIRSYQFKSAQWGMGKNFDATGGFGPDMVTPDELPNGVGDLRIQCRINGETLQDSSTIQHIFDVETVIETVSEAMTLNPGDVIIMGTPPGVGSARTPNVWMKDGDVCEIEIEGIGILSNPIVAE
ncbi:MAG: fumarylacetoacetate hydrolase family protein [Alphaproteobacteria bacterium]|jgi:2-keto-4-pentenoate hydratase/2-oxohepta-3-ene-1,7-dioic acid hydratase in catechol pathway|nr:fumarylacetoacetate hydrolase family protein [Alphaproteobacteria bacterium]